MGVRNRIDLEFALGQFSFVLPSRQLDRTAWLQKFRK
jgi:hypothetical protein